MMNIIDIIIAHTIWNTWGTDKKKKNKEDTQIVEAIIVSLLVLGIVVILGLSIFEISQPQKITLIK